MSDIGRIDTSFSVKHAPVERLPARDFVHELSNTGEGRIADHKGREGDLRSGQSAHAEFTAAKPPVDISSTADELLRKSSGMAEGMGSKEQLGVPVMPKGITEALPGSRVYGVHLLAGTYLSELATRKHSNTDAESDIAVSDAASLQMQEVAPDVPSVSDQTTSIALLRKGLTAAMSFVVQDEVGMAANIPQSSGAARLTSEAASAMSWPPSSLRLTKQRDGSSVIWLRDYRMSDEDTSRLVEALLSGAEAEGIRLGRIILNGREVWTSQEKY